MVNWTSVAVPQDNRRVWNPKRTQLPDSPYTSRTNEIGLTDEALEWLERVVGRQNFSTFDDGDIAIKPIWQLWSRYHHLRKDMPTKIMFSDANQAMLFKLTFL